MLDLVALGDDLAGVPLVYVVEVPVRIRRDEIVERRNAAVALETLLPVWMVLVKNLIFLAGACDLRRTQLTQVLKVIASRFHDLWLI